MSYTFHSLNVRFGPKKVIFNQQIQVKEVEVSFQDNNNSWQPPISRVYVDVPNRVAVLPYDPYTNSIAFIENFRIGTLQQREGPWHLEIPNLQITQSDCPLKAVQQALQDNICCEGLVTEFISDFYTSPALSNERLFLYCAGIDTTRIQKSEKIEILTVFEAKDAIYGNYFQDASTIMSLHWLIANQERLQEKWQ